MPQRHAVSFRLAFLAGETRLSRASRQQAVQIFQRAMQQATVSNAVAEAVHCRDGVLQVRDHRIPLQMIKKIYLIAMGKAAAPLFDEVRAVLPANIECCAVVSATTRPALLDTNASGEQYFQGGHPVPNLASIAAAQAALDLLTTADASTLVIFLITGGASAMFDLPISPTITLEDMIALNQLLVASGAPIRDINCIRKHFSAVKGGRLGMAASDAASQITLLVSDVPADQLDALASGPTMADSTTVSDCMAILHHYQIREHMPVSLQKLVAAGLPETPKYIYAAYQPVVLLGNETLVQHAREAAEQMGYEVVIDNRCDDWKCEDAAVYLLERLLALPRENRPLCLISGGEVTVTLPRNPHSIGVGGRNQHFALQCALQMQQMEMEVTVLSVGSDGIDGNSLAAGAVADNATVARATSLDISAQSALDGFDSYSLFQSLGDAIVTGPTGNNLRDLRILLRP